jgi:16S rRNA (guanine527-N7)-methyltransferase
MPADLTSSLAPPVSEGLLALQAPFSQQLRDLGIMVGKVEQGRLFAFLTHLQRWNATHNLTAVVAPSELVRTHLLDPLLALPFLVRRASPAQRSAMVDVGAGAGIPAIPWALANPSLRLSLVEKSGKKAAFLRHVTGRLALSDRLSVLQADVQSLQAPQTYAIIVSRAFAALPKFLSLTLHLSAPDTRWVYMAGRLETIEGLDINKSTYTHPSHMPKLDADLVLDAIDVIDDPNGMHRHLVWLRRVL